MRLLQLKVVLAAVDVDESAPIVLRGAHALATSAGAKLHVMHVDAGERSAHQSKDGRSTMTAARMQRLIDDAGIPAGGVNVHLLNGDPAGAIRSIADLVSADAIVLGRHRGATASDAMGSTALRVVTNSWAPCLILSQPLRLPLSCVLAPVDLSDTSRGALMVALSWASALRGAKTSVSLQVLLVESPRVAGGGPSMAKQTLDDELDRLRQDAGSWANVDVGDAVVTSDDVVAAIADTVRETDADLVVLGTRGLGVDAVGRLGSVSLGVAQRTAASVLLVPPAVWQSH